MEKRFLEEIIKIVEESGQGDFLPRVDEIKKAYKSQDIGYTMRMAYDALKDVSSYILTAENVKTISGTVKIMRYLDAYNRAAAFIDVYDSRKETVSGVNEGKSFGGCCIQKESLKRQ